MSDELAYVLITPYTIQKSRTGGVFSRLLARTDLEFIGARMLAPTCEFIEQYAKNIENSDSEENRTITDLLGSYVRESFAPHDGKYHRLMLLLFKGENARQKICRQFPQDEGNKK